MNDRFLNNFRFESSPSCTNSEKSVEIASSVYSRVGHIDGVMIAGSDVFMVPVRQDYGTPGPTSGFWSDVRVRYDVAAGRRPPAYVGVTHRMAVIQYEPEDFSIVVDR